MQTEVVEEIHKIAEEIKEEMTIMELCGTHTEAVARFGIKKILPKNIRLLSGPGCPVCVTDQRDIDNIINLSMNGIPIACYGDVLRVPGNLILSRKKKGCLLGKKTNIVPLHERDAKMCFRNGDDSRTILSLDKARELGADITEVYSIEDALSLKESKPDLVFFGLGFETTTPMTAAAIKEGLTVYSSHKAFVPAMQAIIDAPSLKIDGFINPGHVSTIIGIEPYKKIKARGEKTKSIPQVIAGFEAEDIVIAILMILRQLLRDSAAVENEYIRCVKYEGNVTAVNLIREVFEIKDALWRGLGKIPNSGFEIRKEYSRFDAKVKYKDILSRLKDLEHRRHFVGQGCICGAILRGLKEPRDCKLFNKKCTPENPVGACMVSQEGACGIAARFGQ